MDILVACEESQRVCTAFREKGHNAFSCDIIDCSGGHPEWHIKQDVTYLLDGFVRFITEDGVSHECVYHKKWDMIIAFPPCTYLTVTANRWFNIERYGDRARDRLLKRIDAKFFFLEIAHANCDKIAIENPIGIMSTQYRKPDQIIQPYMFGDAFEKRTCLWLKGLPKLQATDIVDIPPRIEFKSGKTMPEWYSKLSGNGKERSKTFPGIAKAMAEQWG